MAGKGKRLPVSSMGARAAPRLHHVQVDASGLRLAVTEWPPSPPAASGAAASHGTVVLLHGTGFHGRCWDAVVARLPPGLRCLAPDARGHGRSDKPEPVDGVYRWPSMAADVLVVLRYLRVQGALGVGHSMGGYLLLHAALADPSLFRGLLLLDPVVLRQRQYEERAQRGTPPPPPVARRFDGFASPADMFERLRGRSSYQAWRENCLADYCAHGLVGADQAAEAASGWPEKEEELGPAPRGPPGLGRSDRVETPTGPGLRLACPPRIEAATYLGSACQNDRGRYGQLSLPVAILRAEKSEERSPSEGGDFNRSPTDPDLWRLFPRGRDVHLEGGMTHFIPMQDPALVARETLALESAGALAMSRL